MRLIVLSTFLCHHCTTTTWKCLILRFIENVKKTKTNKRLVIIVKKFERMRIHFLLKSDVLTAVTVVVPWTWGNGAWREKSTFGHRNWLFRSRGLNSLLFLLGEGNMSRGIWRGKYEQGKYILHFLVTVISYCFSSALPCYNQTRHQLFRQWFITRGYVIYSPKKNKGNRAKLKINGFNEFELFRSMDGFALHLIIIIIIIIFIEDINFTDKWFTKESSKIKKEQKGKIKTNIWIYKN